MRWTRAINLVHWADTTAARHQLPLLLRKLLGATFPKAAAINFPADEQVQRPGFDGIVELGTGDQFVPDGKSCWEMGAGTDPREKANEDFAKRTEALPAELRQETTFMFVTPRTWQGKDNWASEQRKKCQWKDVRVLDANDLEHWLERAPSVDIWLATEIGLRPAGVLDPNRYWQSLSSIADVPLSPLVFLASRESICKKLQEFLNNPPASVFLKSSGPRDGLDFLVAMLQHGETPSAVLERMIIVDEIEAWHHLTLSQAPLLLVGSSRLRLSASDVAEAVSRGHHVIVLGSVVVTPDTNIIHLKRQDHLALCSALIDCGFDESRARSVALGCSGSTTILKRLIAQHPDTEFPEWSRSEHLRALAPFALIGGWCHVDPDPPAQVDVLGIRPKPPNDLWLLEQIGLDRPNVEAAVGHWTGGDEPLFIQFGAVTLIASREDGWYLLGGSIGRELLERFEEVAVLVLEETNPALSMEPERRWMANLYGKVHSHTFDLRRSITESLALMTTRPTVNDPQPQVDFEAAVRRILQRILQSGATWQRWASLGGLLPTLFECDPEFMLARVEDDLRCATPQVPQLFADAGSSLFSSSLHCHLLWALEGVAWSPEFLPRAALILVSIATQTETKSGNNPLGTLSGIFSLDAPQTNANCEQRLQVIEQLVQRYPDVGRKLIETLLPSTMGSLWDPTHMPRWRTWAHGWSRDRAFAERADYVEGFQRLVQRLADVNPARWVPIVEGMLRLSVACGNSDDVLNRLDEVASACESRPNVAFELWEQLRQTTKLHRQHPSAHWAFPSGVIDRLCDIRDRLVPQDVLLRNLWLFGRRAELEDPDVVNGVELHDTALKARRGDALRAIINERGLSTSPRKWGNTLRRPLRFGFRTWRGFWSRSFWSTEMDGHDRSIL